MKFPTRLLFGSGALFLIVLTFRQNLWSLDLAEYHPYIIRVILSTALLALVGGIAGFLIMWFLTFKIISHYFFLRWFPRVVGAYLGTAWGIIHWEQILLYFKGIKIGSMDPILGKDIAFYRFGLPFYESLFIWLFSLFAVSLVSLLIGIMLQMMSEDAQCQFIKSRNRSSSKQYYWLSMNIGLLLFLLAWGKYLERYDMLYLQMGPDFDVPNTPINVLLPSVSILFLMIVMGCVFMLLPIFQSRFPHGFKSAMSNRYSQANFHLRWIKYALAATLFILFRVIHNMDTLRIIQPAPHVSSAVVNSPGRQGFEKKHTGKILLPHSLRQPVRSQSNCLIIIETNLPQEYYLDIKSPKQPVNF